MEDIPDVTVDVLAIGAHPDDVDYICGGAIARFVKKGVSVGIVDLTSGEPTPRNDKYRSPTDFDEDYEDVRRKEALESAKVLGASRVTLNLPNRQLADNLESRCNLARVIRKWKPKVVLIPYSGNAASSPDHKVAHDISNAGIFFARLTKYDDYMGNLPTHNPLNIFFYSFMGNLQDHPMTYMGQLTTFYIDITEFKDIKKQAIECYKSQFDDPEKSANRVVSRNGMLGTNITGIENMFYLEKYYSTIPLVITDDQFKFQFFQ